MKRGLPIFSAFNLGNLIVQELGPEIRLLESQAEGTEQVVVEEVLGRDGLDGSEEGEQRQEQQCSHDRRRSSDADEEGAQPFHAKQRPCSAPSLFSEVL